MHSSGMLTLPELYLHLTCLDYFCPHFPSGKEPPPSHHVANTEDKRLLKTNIFARFENRKSAVDCVKMHSTLQGKRIKMDRKRSNNCRVTFVCSTNDCQSNTKNTPHQCDYEVVLVKSRCRKGEKARLPWAIRENSKHQHCVNCLSQAKITFREVKMLTHDTSVGTIKDTINRIASSTTIPKMCVPKSVAVRFRLGCWYTGYENYDINWSKLDKWGAQLVERNPGSRFHLEVDDQGRFTRMFVGLGSVARVAIKTGIEFSGVDGTFFKHVVYKGVVLMLVTRDGNNQLLVVGWVICAKENADNYHYFAENLKKVEGVEEYLNRPQHLVYSDRHKGIPAFESQFECGKANCIVHIIDNLREHLRKNKIHSVNEARIHQLHL